MRIKNFKLSILNWLKVFVISILLCGCDQVQQIEIKECEIPESNLDSLFSIGDSVLAGFYIQQAKQRLYTDELTKKLQEKQIQEHRERIIYKDTIIYREEIQTLYTTLKDTIHDTIYVTDTVVKKRKKKEN